MAGASRQRTHAVINEHEAMPAQFAHNADFNLPGGRMALQIAAAVREDGFHAVDATEIATALTGDSIAANLFTLGYAWQKGLVPIAAAAIEEAVRLNGVAVRMNLQAFLWGRRTAAGEKAVRAVIGAKAAAKPQSLDDVVARRMAFLTDYQNAAYAQSYADFVGLVRAAESALPGRRSGLGEAVAKFLFKLMAYKDEYEVARLYTDGAFAQSLKSRFTGDYKLNFHLAPPILGRRDGFTGQPVKSVFGPWMMTGFKLLARLKGLRGTAFDVFGYTAERRRERALIGAYKDTIAALLHSLAAANHALAVEIAAMPEQIRGFGHVKDESVARAKSREAELLARFGGKFAIEYKALAAE